MILQLVSFVLRLPSPCPAGAALICVMLTSATPSLETEWVRKTAEVRKEVGWVGGRVGVGRIYGSHSRTIQVAGKLRV